MAALGATLWAAPGLILGKGDAERWFMPGPLGHEPGEGAASLHGGFRTRAFSGLGRPEEVEWGKHNNLTEPFEFMHHLYAVFSPDIYAAHPEFFPTIDGRRFQPRKVSVAWNPDLGRLDVAQYAAEQAKAWFAAHPTAEAFSLGINDSVQFGDSPETRALTQPTRWFRGRPDFTRLLFTFMNRAAEEVAKSYPDKYLGCLAYYWTEDAPPFAVDPHVVPVLTADRSQGYDPKFRAEEFDLQARWAKAVGVSGAESARATKSADGVSPRLGLYDYLYGAGFLIPRLPLHALAEQLRHARDVGFTDYYAEIYPNWGLDGPQPWIVSQLIQDPGQSVDTLLDEYCRRYFQSASGAMRQFFDRCERQWMGQQGPAYWLKHYRNDSQALVFASAACIELRTLLSEASRQASSDLVRQRVAFVSDAFGVTERFVAMQEARAELAARVLSRPAHGLAEVRCLADYLGKRSDFIAYTQALTARSTLAFASFSLDDYLRDHPAFPVALTLANEGLRSDLAVRTETEIKDALDASAAIREGRTREVVVNGSLEGALAPGRRITGLAYGIDLPAPWLSQVEPTEKSATVVSGGSAHTGTQGLRIAGAENTTVFQWVPVKGGRLYVASVATRAQVSPSDAVILTLGWLDAQQRPVGTIAAVRLPDGKWPEWIQLRQGARAPATAVWAGISIRAQHQVLDDWAEFDDFSLLEIQPQG